MGIWHSFNKRFFYGYLLVIRNLDRYKHTSIIGTFFHPQIRVQNTHVDHCHDCDICTPLFSFRFSTVILSVSSSLHCCAQNPRVLTQITTLFLFIPANNVIVQDDALSLRNLLLLDFQWQLVGK